MTDGNCSTRVALIGAVMLLPHRLEAQAPAAVRRVAGIDVRYEVKDCQGHVVKSGRVKLNRGLADFVVPVSGLVALSRLQ
jgi:hypothetical protein